MQHEMNEIRVHTELVCTFHKFSVGLVCFIFIDSWNKNTID